MTITSQKTPREKSIEKGKQIVTALIVYFILAEVFVSLINLLNGQVITVISIIRFAITIVTVVYLYKGQNWAKLLLSLGVSLGLFRSMYTVYLQLRTPTTSIPTFIFMVILTILQGTAAYLLIFSSDIDEFLRSRKV